jgi:hypothetical protein
MTERPPSDSLPLHVQLIQSGIALWGSKMLVAAAQLGLADRIGGQARSADELAGELELHPRSLYRFMRSLAGMGILTEVSTGTFGLTPLGEALKADAPGSARATILTLVGPICSLSFDRLLHSLKTGETGFKQAYGMPLFDYLAEHPDEASIFSETMVGIHGREPPAVAEAYDFSGFERIVDVGGATGNMLVHILGRHEGPRGVLFDLPHVVADAPDFIARHGLQDRISIESGSFFESAPAGGDAYILSHIIHDWQEDECRTILGNCRRAMQENGKLLIVEMVLPEGDTPHFGKMTDMVMLVAPGGEERTAEEYAVLLESADFRLTQVVPTASEVSVVEAVPA